MNEYRVNQWTEEEVRDVGRDLHSKVPAGALIALSSPHAAHAGSAEMSNEEMAESIEALYGRTDYAGANVMTIHLLREPQTSRWADPFGYNMFLPALPKINNEPFGPGASTGGDIADPARIAHAYQKTGEAGWVSYIGHSAWSVFNGRLPDEYRRPYDVRQVWEHTNMLAIAHQLRTVREGGTIAEPGPAPTPSPGPTPGGDEVRPYPNEEQFWQNTYAPKVIELWEKAGRHDLVAFLRADPRALIWYSRMGHSSGDSKISIEAAMDKHLQELADELNISR